MNLPDGRYPFIDRYLPLAQLAMVEVPASLEALLKAEAARNGIEIVRDTPVELHCQSAEFPDATFLIYWPRTEDRMHMLAPKEFSTGRA